MATTALEKIQAIQLEAEQKIAALKQEAITELVKKIAETKAELAALEEEYTALTGRNLKGEKADNEGKRIRLSEEEKAALTVSVTEILKEATSGIKFGEIVSKTGAPISAVRNTLKGIKSIRTTGQKASTLYFLK